MKVTAKREVSSNTTFPQNPKSIIMISTVKSKQSRSLHYLNYLGRAVGQARLGDQTGWRYHILRREGKGREGKGREGKGREGKRRKEERRGRGI